MTNLVKVIISGVAVVALVADNIYLRVKLHKEVDDRITKEAVETARDIEREVFVKELIESKNYDEAYKKAAANWQRYFGHSLGE